MISNIYVGSVCMYVCMWYGNNYVCSDLMSASSFIIAFLLILMCSFYLTNNNNCILFVQLCDKLISVL